MTKDKIDLAREKIRKALHTRDGYSIKLKDSENGTARRLTALLVEAQAILGGVSSDQYPKAEDKAVAALFDYCVERFAIYGVDTKLLMELAEECFRGVKEALASRTVHLIEPPSTSIN